jgi:hypothetical protein
MVVARPEDGCEVTRGAGREARFSGYAERLSAALGDRDREGPF